MWKRKATNRELAFLDAMHKLEKANTATDIADSARQSCIDAARTAATEALETMPAGESRREYAEMLSEGPSQCSKDRSDDGWKSVMDYFLARCGELRDTDGTVLVAGGRLDQVWVTDGGFCVSYFWGNTFAWNCNLDGTRLPMYERLLIVHDPKATMQLIKARGIFGVWVTFRAALDVELLYRLIDADVITSAKLFNTVDATPFEPELEKYDDSDERADIRSRAAKENPPHNATSVWCSNARLLGGLFPGG